MPSVEPFNPIPSIYDPRLQREQWGEITENMTLPLGKVFSHGKDEYTLQQIMDKGVTHISKFHLPVGTQLELDLRDAGKTYDAVPKTNEIFNMPDTGLYEWRTSPEGIRYNIKYWPNGPLGEADAKAKAWDTDISHALWVGETNENEPWIDIGAPMWGHFFPILRQRYQERFGSRGIPYFISANYYVPSKLDWWTLGFSTRANHKNKPIRPFSQWEHTHYAAGGTLSATNLITEGIYVDSPDSVRKNVLRMIYKMLVFKAMGFYAGAFLFPIHEYRPNNYYEIVYPQSKYPESWGRFFRQDKVPMCPNEIMAYAFFAMEYGDLYIQWNAGGKNTADKINGSWPNGDLWFPGAATEPTPQEQAGAGGGWRATNFPHYAFDGDGKKVRYPWSGGADYSYFGVRMWNKTAGPLTGAARKYCRYRINGGAWVTQDSSSEFAPVTDSYLDETPLCYTKTKDGKRNIVFYLPTADNIKRTVEIEQEPGLIYSMPIVGNKVHSVIVNI